MSHYPTMHLGNRSFMGTDILLRHALGDGIRSFKGLFHCNIGDNEILLKTQTS